MTGSFAGTYGGTVAWKTTGGMGHSGPFMSNRNYRATVTLTAAPGYTFDREKNFTYNGLGDGKITTGHADNGTGSTVTIDFPETVPP